MCFTGIGNDLNKIMGSLNSTFSSGGIQCKRSGNLPAGNGTAVIDVAVRKPEAGLTPPSMAETFSSVKMKVLCCGHK